MAPSRSLPVSLKLGLAFGLLCLLTLCAALAGAWGVTRVKESAGDLYTGGTVHLRDLGEVQYLVTRSRVVLMDAMQTDTVDHSAKRIKQFDEYTAKTRAIFAEIGKNMIAGEERRLFDATVQHFEALHRDGLAPLAKALAADAGRPDRAAAYKVVSKLNPAFTEAMEKLMEGQVNEAKGDFEHAQSVAARANWLVGVTSLLAVAAALAVGWAVTRGLVRALGAEPAELAQVAQRIADGSLAEGAGRTATPGSVMASMLAMQARLATVVRDVLRNAESVASASAQITQGNQDLSGRTEQQASALQQTAATMEELGNTVRHNADNAQQANQLARGASSIAQQGGEVVGRVVVTMKGISDSSRRIGDIIGVIDGIAFQTNILALNAAVEAARAGEQGRGFAVVASEVRSLAQRSAEAAKEIKSLIGESVSQVEQGASLVDVAGKTMGEIVDSIQRVSDIVAEISSASVEQSSGVRQVGDAVNQMDQATQQNAALVEESAAAAESMKRQAQQLVSAVSVFRVTQGAAA